MRKIIGFITLLCGFTALWAADLPPPAAGAPATHPLTGSWTWTLPGKQCRETLKYGADGMRSGSSGEEVSKARYEVSAMPSLLGFYRLEETTTESNGKRDCAGDLHDTSAGPVIRFIQFSPKRDQFIVCKEESLKACFGPLKRQ